MQTLFTKKVNLLREDIYKGRFHRRKSKEDDEQLQVILQEKKQMYKKTSFKGSLFTIMIATLILITYNIFISQHENVFHVISWRRLANIWKPTRGLHVTYVSHSQIDWLDVSKVVKKIIYDKQTIHTVGLLNFNETETFEWKTRMFPDSANHIVLHLDSIYKNMTWESLYPNWIDEEQRYHVPKCPSLPKLSVPAKMIDVIAIKLPCRNKANWSKDVARLHLQLASADYDCNWDSTVYQQYASDVAHNNWWKLHDSVPSQLQQFCHLSSKQKVKLERLRQRAATANLSDGHWKIEIRDPRKNI
ncbi:Glycosyl transferase, family 8 [Artemisia annua]|uniref:Glycosyl transferase, family 8 n=1 Tax=Artemisia annua TaxID=35608 RepID=A0A2U1LQM3_ARTAN|nr:Glycosyl transferase, family 8 [Artemisia annua]